MKNVGFSYRSTRFRLIPGSREKHDKLMRLTGACIHVWNRFLQWNKVEYMFHERVPWLVKHPSITFFSLGKEFSKYRKETDWLRELPFECEGFNGGGRKAEHQGDDRERKGDC